MCSSILDQIFSSDADNEHYFEELCEKLIVIFKSAKFDVTSEATLHHIIFLILLYCKGKCFLEVKCTHVNRKRLDLLMLILHNNLGIIFELKFGMVEDKEDITIKNADANFKK